LLKEWRFELATAFLALPAAAVVASKQKDIRRQFSIDEP
jgi:hypothetical protein